MLASKLMKLRRSKAFVPRKPNAKAALPLLRKIANVEDGVSGRAYELFRFGKPLGRRGEELVARERAVDSTKLFETLISKNWEAPEAEREAQVKAVISEKPANHWLCAAKIGWQGDRRQFVLHGSVVGAGSSKMTLKPPMWIERVDGHLHKRGNLKEWKKGVADPARFSTRIMMLMSCAFAAPLLTFVELQSFAVLLFGASKAGKTTALLAASSVMGIGREADLPNFNTTDSAFFERARLFNDLVYPGNELGLMRGPKKEAYHRIRTLLYSFSEGGDTARHTQSSYSSSSAAGKWRGIFLPNSEHSFDALAGIAGVERDAGEYARCIDVPVLSPKSRTVFDRRPTSVGVDQFPAWSRKALVKLREACSHHHGVAIDAYVEFLIENRETCELKIRGYMLEFEEHLGDLSHLDGAIVHAAKNCSLIYAGGRMAIEAAVVPWQPHRLLSAIGECFKATLQLSQKAETILERGKCILKAKLESLPVRTSLGVDVAQVPGFRCKLDGDLVGYTVSSAAMKSWLSGPGQHEAVILWLDQAKLLRSSKAKPVEASRSLAWAVTTPRWQGTKKVKSYCFVDPFTKD